MFDKEKVQNYITKFLPWTLKRYKVTNPKQINGRKFLTITGELWDDLVLKGLVPREARQPKTKEALSVYNEVERMIRDSWEALGEQEMHGESFKKSSKKLVALNESSKKRMKRKPLNEGCACEGEETTPAHAEFISVDRVNRFMLQMSEEEQESMSFRDVIAGILGTKPENIKSMKRAGSGWRVKAQGEMDDLEGILDDNVDTLKRLKGVEDEEWADEEDDWTDSEDDMEDWEREGYNSEIAYQNRWRDYED